MPTQNFTYHLTAPATPLAALYPLHPTPYTLKTFTFSAKERDVETGLSYFGSRYYSSDLSIWLSVDPQAAKYPGLSPFTYCADNPIKLVDPNGEEVEYNSFEDRLITFFARVLSSDFRQKFKVLKQSEETYVFNKNNGGINNFTTDGEKLFINYSINEQSRSEGQTIFSNLRHETTHGIQFEYGEIGFKNIGTESSEHWIPINYDLMDEYDAHSSQNNGGWPKVQTSRWHWQHPKGESESDKKNFLTSAMQKVNNYSKLSLEPTYNSQTDRTQNCSFYVRPHVKRSKGIIRWY